MEVKDVLLSIHEEIKECRRQILYKKNKLDELQEYMKVWECEQIAKIADEVNEAGKPVYSNETKRQAELERRKKENTGYQKWLAEYKSLKLEYDMSVIILQSMLDKQENMRALTRIMGVQ